MPFKTFDVVLFTNLLEHISNPGLALEGLKKFIDEDSTILITVPHAFGLLNFIWYSVGVFEERLQHVSMYNIAGLTNLLERHGYYVVRYCTCCEKRPSSIMKKIIFYFAYSTLRLFPKFGGTIFIEARLRRCGS